MRERQGDIFRYVKGFVSCFPLPLVRFAFFECARFTPLMAGETSCKSRRGIHDFTTSCQTSHSHIVRCILCLIVAAILVHTFGQLLIHEFIQQSIMPSSQAQIAKRELVTLLLALAVTYSLGIGPLNRG